MGHGRKIFPGNPLPCQNPWQNKIQHRGSEKKDTGRQSQDGNIPETSIQKHGARQYGRSVNDILSPGIGNSHARNIVGIHAHAAGHHDHFSALLKVLIDFGNNTLPVIGCKGDPHDTAIVIFQFLPNNGRKFVIDES